MALTTSGMVMNGPTPIMSIMFSAVALHSPIPRMRLGEPGLVCVEDDMPEGATAARAEAGPSR